MGKRVVVIGMSGGVDSSVAAFLLKKQGYDVRGIFMKNYSDSKNELTGECSWREEWRMAQKIAFLLKIPIKKVDYEKNYKKEIIEKMYRDYSRGLTPNPDILCNKVIKFPFLWNEAKKEKADFIATGHYARVRHGKNGFYLLAGIDKNKDQSYFLYELNQEHLSHVLFPVGEYKKEEIREIARGGKFPNWDKKGTRGICFVGKRDMKLFLKKKIKEKKGKVILPSGEVIGVHPGSMFFTIGERAGERNGFEINRENLGGKICKLYVAQKKGNTLIVAPEGHSTLKRKKIFVKNFHLIDLREKVNNKKFNARIRHLGEMHKGRINRIKGRIIFNFVSGVEGVAEGQSVVLYDGERVVGGGEIRVRQ
ncbi:MAG: tRNA 2-thiouridine(34) synthase MnmA [Nanoarchaeota archaeon]|mgnify:CR=1 FL=1